MPWWLFAVLFIFLNGLNGCSVFSLKKKEKEEKTYDFRQNLTAKYNILYNSNLLLDAEQKEISASKKENYQIRLSVFDEPLAAGDPHVAMDSVVRKGYKIINDKSESKYLNEALYVIGKAHYLKGDYYTAIEFFNVLTDPADGEYAYKPLAYAWRSRAQLQLGKLREAEYSIDSAFMFLDDNLDTRTFVNAGKANHLLSTEQALEAIPYLEFALESVKNKDLKNRWGFLLYQLYQERGDVREAYEGFEKLSNSNVPFDMAFEASLRAMELQTLGSGNKEEKIRILKKMLREGKNEGYKDRILFRIATLYLQDGEEDEAFAHFNASLLENIKSVYQTTETYLTMADYLFEKERYSEAQLYYDSVSMVLPDDYTDVNPLRRKLTYMQELTQLHTDILWQDTLLRLAAVSDGERATLIETYADQEWNEKRIAWENENNGKKKSKKRRRSIENDRQPAHSSWVQANVVQPDEIKTDSRFYFNNQDAMTLGQVEFKKRWGNRQLKEDWRYQPDLSQDLKKDEIEESHLAAEEKSSEEPDETLVKAAVTQRFTQAYPKDQTAYDSVRALVHDHLIVIGNLYREYTNDIEAAIGIHKQFLNEFPESEERPEVLYSLFRMYEIQNNMPEAHAAKQQLLSLYPQTVYALVADNPRYLKELEAERAVFDRAFDKAFGFYSVGNHERVIEEVDKILAAHPASTDSSIIAQLEYLRALAIGRVKRVENFEEELRAIVEKYPQDSLVTPLVEEHLAFMDENPQFFFSRVNAIQDVDRSRETFVDEPYMTPWPDLYIHGDYRTGVALEEEIKKVEADEKADERWTIREQTLEKRKEVDLALGGIGKVQIIGIEEEEEDEQIIEEEAQEEVLAQEILETEEEVLQLTEEEAEGLEMIEEERQRLEIAFVGESRNPKRKEEAEGLKALDKELDRMNRSIPTAKLNLKSEDFSNKTLFPDEAEYYFVVNVEDERVNLASSRYGIGQFIRTRFRNKNWTHQLAEVNDENQLIYIGTFNSLAEVRDFEKRIIPLMEDIMKIPEDDYDIFIITKKLFDTLKTRRIINDYSEIYFRQ